MENIINESKRRKLDRPITGVIQEDRIWEQWYTKEAMESKLPKMTQKDYLFKCIDNEPDRIIINNRGMKTFTVSQFKQKVEEFELAFAATGLKKGDVICTIGLTTPELYAIKYSCTSLGIITCNLNVLDMGVTDDGKNRLYRQIENVNPKMIFTLDILEDKIYPVINDDKFKEIIKVSMPLEYSTPIYNPERAILNLKNLKSSLMGKKIDNKISLNNFLELGKTIDFSQVNEVYEEKMPCNISFTSGTTGINKAVLLSHDANNALAFQQKIGNFFENKHYKQLALVPPFLAFWDADIVHSVLCVGGQNIIELTLDYDKIPKYFKKYDVNCGIWSQYLWSSLLTLPKEQLKKATENVELAIIGGERQEINAAETFYNATGVRQITGYGASEVNTTFSITHPNCNKLGTSGIPLPFNNVKIVNDSLEDLTYNKPGKLFITGPCLMNEYYNMKEQTKKAIYTDKNGVSWYNTGDYAVLDNDGCLTVLDRYKEPVIIKNNNKTEKVNLLDIVEVIKLNRNVKICKMTYNDDKLLLHLVVDSFMNLSQEEAIDSILNTIKSNLPEKYWPDYINVVSELPRTAVGKVDYKVMQDQSRQICEEYHDEKKLCLVRGKN